MFICVMVFWCAVILKSGLSLDQQSGFNTKGPITYIYMYIALHSYYII